MLLQVETEISSKRGGGGGGKIVRQDALGEGYGRKKASRKHPPAAGEGKAGAVSLFRNQEASPRTKRKTAKRKKGR